MEIDNNSMKTSNYEINKVLSYFELVYTFTKMVVRCVFGPYAYYTRENSVSPAYIQIKNINLILENIESFLEDLNYEIIEKDEDRWEIVEKTH